MPGQPFVATKAAVASPHQLASAAGLRALLAGGTAVDAQIAVHAVLSVVYPNMTGLGGDAFWLIFEAATGQVHALNGSGRSAAAATRERYRSLGYDRIPPRGPHAALTVPGAVDSWFEAHRRFGRLSIGFLLEPAIDYAESGSPVGSSLAGWLARDVELLSRYEATRRSFLSPEGAPPRAGDRLAQPDLARTLRAIAANGPDELYRGDTARRLLAALGTAGSPLAQADLAEHRSNWVEPISLRYRAFDAYNFPPNSQGFAALQILGILQSTGVASLDHLSAEYVHLVVEATKLAFEDRDRYLTDPEFAPIPLSDLLDRDYLRRRAGLIGEHARRRVEPPRAVGDTSFSAAVDADGNAVAMIQSLYFDFGTAFVAGDTGILLQSRGCYFSLDDRHPNRLEPRKRTAHTLTPALLLRDGRPALVYGAMGGEGQPQTQAALVTRVVDFGLDPQAAIDAPRWLYGPTWGETTVALRLESRFPSAVAADLRSRGHEVDLLGRWDELMGHANAIQIDRDRGCLLAGFDPRSDGAALGY
ncbi:MAG: gamma-glutamyltransferase [Chloroflexi bacterium]|nr:gamma-glutamyltransferase [Chloroflexota bacterium]